MLTIEHDSASTVVKNVCHLDCPDTCSMLVTVKDGVAVELRGDPDHPFTRGFLCQKMARYLERIYSPDRLLYPMRRVGRKGEGQFERITWELALDTIAQRFATVAGSAEGPEAILPYSYCGTMGKLQSSSLDRRFFHRLGASRLDRTICATAVRSVMNTRWAEAALAPTRWPCRAASSSSTGARTRRTPTATSGA